MTPVAWVAGIWLTALDLHLAQREVKTQQNGKKRMKTCQVSIFKSDCDFRETSWDFKMAE